MTNDKIKAMKKELEEVFESLKFSKEEVDGRDFYVYKDTYHCLTYLGRQINGFVIETGTFSEVLNGITEDDDIVTISENIDDMKKELKGLLELYYMD